MWKQAVQGTKSEHETSVTLRKKRGINDINEIESLKSRGLTHQIQKTSNRLDSVEAPSVKGEVSNLFNESAQPERERESLDMKSDTAQLGKA